MFYTIVLTRLARQTDGQKTDGQTDTQAIKIPFGYNCNAVKLHVVFAWRTSRIVVNLRKLEDVISRSNLPECTRF